LDEWPVCDGAHPGRFTTVGSWRGGYGPVEHDGHTYRLKGHQFRQFSELPGRAPPTFEIALAIDPADARDTALLVDNGWRVVDPVEGGGGPPRFSRYVQHSA